jgi:hypothetical protein
MEDSMNKIVDEKMLEGISVSFSFLSAIATKIGINCTIAMKTFIIHYLVNFFCKYRFIIEKSTYAHPQFSSYRIAISTKNRTMIIIFA